MVSIETKGHFLVGFYLKITYHFYLSIEIIIFNIQYFCEDTCVHLKYNFPCFFFIKFFQHMLLTKFQFTDLMFNQVPQFAMQIRMAFYILLEGGNSRIQIKFYD